jgi:hypothetical protein
MRLYLSKLTPLLADKAADVRKAAGEALAGAYLEVDSSAVLNYVAHSSGPDLVRHRHMHCCLGSKHGCLTPLCMLRVH